jgi:hypothetical protein
MNITIRKNPEYPLKIPTFKSDKVLKEGLPVPYNLLVNGYRFTVLIGKPRSGKTSLLISLFSDSKLLKQTYDNVILIAPNASLNSIDKKDNPFRKIPDERRYTSMDSIPQIRDQVMFYASEGMDSIIIIDDETASLKDTHIQREFQDLINNRRHYKTSIMLLTQTYKAIPLTIRKLLDIGIIMYKPSKPDIESMFDEMFEYKKEVALEIMKLAFQKPYDSLLIEVVSQRIFAGFSELLLEDKN